MKNYIYSFIPLICLVGMFSSSPANAEQCRVTDPTGTPLNVRSNPNGSITGTLKNGVEVDILQISRDNQGRSWANIGNRFTSNGRYQIFGWVFKPYLTCDKNKTAVLYIPSEITLHSPKVGGPSLAISFKGEMWITGTLVVRWINTEMQVVLIPDDRSLLPRFRQYKSDIQIRNPKEAIQSVFRQDIANRLSLRQEKAAQVHGRFLINNFATGAICDSGWTIANVILADIPANAATFDAVRDLMTVC